MVIWILVLSFMAVGCSTAPKFKAGDCFSWNHIYKLQPQIDIYNGEPMYPAEEVKSEYGKKVNCP